MKFSQTIQLLQSSVRNLPSDNILQGCGFHTDTVYSSWRDLNVIRQAYLAKETFYTVA